MINLKKISIFGILMISSVFSLSQVNASEGLNYLDGFTKVDGFSPTGTLTTFSNIKTTVDSVEYSSYEQEVYSLINSTRDIQVYDLYGNIKTTVNIMDSSSPALRNVRMKYSNGGKSLFIIGISGVGDYTFPSYPTGNQTGLDNSFIIIKVDMLTRKVSETFVGNSGVNTFISDDIQETTDGGFYINGAFDDGAGSSDGFNVYVKPDGVISKAVVYPSTISLTSTTEKDTTNIYISGKKDNGDGFVTEVDKDYKGIGTMISAPAVLVNAIYYNKTQSKIYSLLSYTGAQNFNGIPLSNNGTFNSSIQQLNSDLTNGSSINPFSTTGIANINKMRIVDSTDIVVYGKYTGSIGGIGNQGGYDGIMLKLTASGSSYTPNGFLLVNTAGDDSFNDLSASKNIDFYFAALGNNYVVKIGNNNAINDSGCYTSYLVPFEFDYSVNQYSKDTNSYIKTYGEEVDGNQNEGTVGLRRVNEMYNIMNENFNVNSTYYSNGMQNKGALNFGTKSAINQTTVNNNLSDFKDIVKKNITLNTSNVNKTTNFGFYQKFGITTDFVDGGYNGYYIDFNNGIYGTQDSDFLGKYVYARGSSLYLGGSWRTSAEAYDGSKQNGYGILSYPVTQETTNKLNASYGKNFTVFPIKDSSGTPTGNYLEYNCGNLICTDANCSMLRKNLSVVQKPRSECGNGIVEENEQCDGTEFQSQFLKDFPAKYYTHSCSDSCSATAIKTNPTSVRISRMITLYDEAKCPIPAEIKAVGVCGDGIKQSPNYYGVNEQCESNEPGCMIKDGSCTLPPFNMKCGDGTIQTLEEKKDDTLANGNKNDDIDETCDDGIGVNGTSGSSCSAICRAKTPPVSGSCGDGIVQTAKEKSLMDNAADLINETCDNGAGNSDAAGSTCTTKCSIPPVDGAYCGNGTIEASNNETCEGNDLNPVGYNPATEFCNSSCRKENINPTDASGAICGDGVITGKEQGDLGGESENVWISKGIGYPFVVDKTSPFGATKTSDWACMKSACGNGVTEVWGGESCDNGVQNGKGVKVGGVLCSNVCKVETTECTCGDGKICGEQMESKELNEYGEVVTYKKGFIEQCDNGSDNDGVTNKNGVVCTNSCQIKPVSCMDSSSFKASAQKYFLLVNSIKNPNASTFRLVYWDKERTKFIDYGNKAKLPDNYTDLDFVPNSQINSTLTSTEKANIKTAKSEIISGIDTILGSSSIYRNWGGNYNINKKLQLNTDGTLGIESLSYSYGILQGSQTKANSGLMRFLFGFITDKLEGQKIEVQIADCSGNYNQITTVSVIGIIDGDTDSVFAVRNFGSAIPKDVYNPTE